MMLPREFTISAAAIALILGALAPRDAGAIPSAQFSINGGQAETIPLQFDGKVYVAENHAISGEGWSGMVTVELDPDPHILYAISLTNNTGSDIDFSFLFSQSITPASTPGTLSHSYSGSTTNGGGAGVVTVTPLAPPGGTPVDGDAITELAVFNVSNTNGATLTSSGIDLGQAFSSNGSLSSDTAPPENSGDVAGPLGSGSYDFMQLDLNFSLTGDGDAFTFNGRAVVVPQPATAGLLGMGLLLLALGGRRRR